MALPSITIASDALSPSSKTIVCQRVTAGHKREVNTDPNANGTSIVEAQTQSYENPTYSLSGVRFTGASGVLTYADCVTLAKLNYDGTNAPLLTVSYGKPGSTSVLSDNAGGTTGIKVVLTNFTTNIDTTDSQGGYLPITQITFRETA